MIIETLKRLFRTPQPAASDAVVIDQISYYDGLERRQRAWREGEQALEKERERVAFVVWGWSRDVVRERYKLPMPAKLPRTGVLREWLDGLYVQEIFALSNSDGWSIRCHIYAGALIDGVRRVQPLPPAELRFPAPKSENGDGRPGAGGGPRRR